MSADAAPFAAATRTPEEGTWTVLRLLRWSGTYLETKGVDRGRLEADHLLAYALGLPRLQLYLQFDRPLLQTELDAFRPLLRRRANREPLQYILGRAAFRDLDLVVDPRVLIPRPETEGLVEEVLLWARSAGQGLRALDLGTGSGAIAISLVTEGPFTRAVATDTSAGALALAMANAAAAGASARIDFREGSLFAPLAAQERFDAIVSNPPYIAEPEREALEPEVRDWEPGTALFAGLDGRAVLRGIVAGAADHLERGGLLALEIGAGQAAAVVEDLRATGGYRDVRVRRDLAGRERVVLAIRDPGAPGPT